MEDLFKSYRLDKTAHLGAGDIRLTIADQDAIMAEVRQRIAEATVDGMLQGRWVECATVADRARREMDAIVIKRGENRIKIEELRAGAK